MVEASNDIHELTAIELESVSGGDESQSSQPMTHQQAVMSQLTLFGAMVGVLAGAGHGRPA